MLPSQMLIFFPVYKEVVYYTIFVVYDEEVLLYYNYYPWFIFFTIVFSIVIL